MFSKKKRKIILLSAIAILLIGGFFLQDYLQNEINSIPLKEQQAIPEQSRLLVIAPHCDDETLGTLGLIRQVLERNGEVRVVIITNGDGFTKAVDRCFSTSRPQPDDYIHLGYIRQQESLSAMKIAGVKPEQVLFLGYPDGGTASLWFEHWDEEDPFLNPRTKTNYSPYFNSYQPYSLYTGENEARDLIRILEDYKPTIIAYPHPNDHHPDHWASHAFVKYALLSSKMQPKEWFYLVHWGEWPAPYGRYPNRPLLPPRSLNQSGTNWRSMPLSAKTVQSKQKAIQSYKSQIKASGRFLLSFDRKNELFGDYPAISWLLARQGSPVDTQIIQNPPEANLYSETKSLIGIHSILLNQNGDQLQIILKIRGKMVPKYKYGIDVTFFQNHQAERVHISALEHKVHVKDITPTSPRMAENITAQLSSEVLIASIPISSLADINTLLINGRVSHGKKMIDQTPCRVVNLLH